MLTLAIAMLLGNFFLTAVNNALRRLHKKDAEKQLKAVRYSFFYFPFHLLFFPKHAYEGVFFATICAQSFVRFCYAAAALAFMSQTESFANIMFYNGTGIDWLSFLLGLFAFMLSAFLFGDYLARILGIRYPENALRICAPIASLFIFIVFPFTFLFLKISQMLSRPVYLDLISEVMGKEEIIDLLQNESFGFDIHDKKLIESVMNFKERIAREVMVPRVNVFSLPADMTIRDSAALLEREGYSRIPIYQNTVDNIIGVLMYKDVLAKYIESVQKEDPRIIMAPIQSIQKGVIHTPETKKISSLLQEFRKKQVHLAIVVDEYGGTEGIVTIEDILEQIVGEIADEYDKEEEQSYVKIDNGWIVDAKMNILDVEEELNIDIPQEGDYDTLGGYIYHTTGMIPPKGFVIHQNNFDMEILKSNERSVEKVRITPILNVEDSTETSIV